MQGISNRQFVFASLLLGLIVTAILLPRSPLQQSVPPRDSGVFLYVGQQILEGRLPYRDVWDHKGPLVYYINALGLFLGHGSWWGMWWVQWQLLVTAAILGYVVLGAAFGNTPAIFASLVWLTSLVFVLGGGNYTEEYALPFQFAALWLFWKFQTSGRPAWHMFLIGLALAASFWLRPNLIGVHLSIVVVTALPALFSPQRPKVVVWIMAIAAGAIGATLPLFGYFAWRGAWSEFVSAVVRYNLVYSTSTLKNKIDAILEGLELLSQSGIVFTALASWVIGCLAIFPKAREASARESLLQVALVGLPIEFLLASASGRTYIHYYLAWLPILALLTAWFASSLLSHFTLFGEVTFWRRKIPLTSVWIWALLFAMILPAYREVFDPVIKLSQFDPPATPAVVERIWDNTIPGDYLLMWGAETSYNFLADRRAPSRFVYQYPLLTCDYVTDAMIMEFLAGIAQHKPLIVDTSSTNAYVPPLNADARKEWTAQSFAGFAAESCNPSLQLADVFAFIETHYRVVEVIQPKQWVIYRYFGDS